MWDLCIILQLSGHKLYETWYSSKISSFPKHRVFAQLEQPARQIHYFPTWDQLGTGFLVTFSFTNFLLVSLCLFVTCWIHYPLNPGQVISGYAVAEQQVCGKQVGVPKRQILTIPWIRSSSDTCLVWLYIRWDVCVVVLRICRKNKRSQAFNQLINCFQ